MRPSAGMPDTYDRPRGGSETSRLNRQHEIWLETVGYCIYPTIRPRMGDDARIADIGTGTGAWLRALSKELPPTVTLDGYDISDLNFPRLEDRPPNVNLIIADGKQPFPAHLHGTYDLVHLRLLVSAMTKDDWAMTAYHAVSLLKPGGSIQWEEPDMWNMRVLRDKVDSQSDNVARLSAYWSNTMGEKLLYGFSTLPPIYQRLGLIDVKEDVVASDRLLHNRVLCARVTAEGMVSWARLRAANGVPDAIPLDQVNELERAVKRDFNTGAYTRYDMFVIMGTKPMP